MTYTFIHSIKFIIFTVLLFTSCIVFSQSSHAYFTTAQKEIDLGNGTGLFLIDYSFGMAKHEVFLPMVASQTAHDATNAVGFSIVNKDGQEVQGKISAIILSHAKITEDGLYKTAKGSGQKFTLAVFFTPEKLRVSEYRLQVTNLPFNFDRKQQLGLNPSELKYYTTKLLAL